MVNSKTTGILLAALIFVLGLASGLVLDRTLSGRRGHPFAFSGTHGARHWAKKPFSPDRMLGRMSKELSLRDDQKAKIGAILAEQKQAMDVLMKDVHPKVEAQMASFRGRIREILDEEQKTRFDRIVERRKGRRPPPPPPMEGASVPSDAK